MLAIVIRVAVLTLSVFLLKITDKYIEPLQAMFFIGITTAITAFTALLITHRSLSVSPKMLGLYVLMGLFSSASYFLLIVILKSLPLGFTEVVGHAYIPLVVLLSWLFLGEHMGWQQWTGAALVLIGVTVLTL